MRFKSAIILLDSRASFFVRFVVGAAEWMALVAITKTVHAHFLPLQGGQRVSKVHFPLPLSNK